MKSQTSVEKVNIDLCLERFDGSRFNLIIAAAARAREIASARVIAERSGIRQTFENKPNVTALMEIAEGKIGQEYLSKVAKARSK